MKEYKLKINSNDYHVVVSGLSNGRADVMVNGQSYSVEIADAGAASAPAVTATAPAPAAKPAAGGAVKSPLPGVVLDIQVAVGDRVGTGQRLMILEAMKMENNIDSDREGTVKEIKVATGDSVLEGDVLLTIE
ncbi:MULTISPECIES: biotin/lipoyl-containing protein [Alistipes]|uniref:biotin/lipoyl-containing protein n=1 Tax=Alistipes TaxID=239759 RepID=UPI001EC84F29|nr:MULTISPECIES: biotin/lipoyl-containing protein [Alistipes]MBS1364483.1 biotin attachment protein [Alistipes sp.]